MNKAFSNHLQSAGCALCPHRHQCASKQSAGSEISGRTEMLTAQKSGQKSIKSSFQNKKTMQEQRYNVFNQIHKGLRGMLYNTALRLQQTDYSQPEALEIVDQLEQVLIYFNEHAENEDQFILPHIRKHNAQLIDELEKDHDVDHSLTQTLSGFISEWKEANSSVLRETIGQRISVAFSEFIAFNLYHMNKEENVLIYLLWKHYTDGEIRQMEDQILHSIPPQTLLAESRWMMRSINDKEVIGWLSAIKQGAPAEVFDTFLQMANEELPATRLANVHAALALA